MTGRAPGRASAAAETRRRARFLPHRRRRAAAASARRMARDRRVRRADRSRWSRRSSPTCSTRIRRCWTRSRRCASAQARGVPLVYEIRAFWEDAAVGNGTGQRGLAALPRDPRARDLGGRARRCGRGDLRRAARRSDRARDRSGQDHRLAQRRRPRRCSATPLPRDDALAAELGLSTATMSIGFIGSFYDYEGLDDLIAAMPALVAARPDAQLLLVGGGPMEAALRAQAAASPVAGAIRFVGRVPHDRGRALLQPDRRARLSAQEDAADRSRHAAEAARGDGAAAAGRGVGRRRASRADPRRRHRHAVRARRPAGDRAGARRPCSPIAPAGSGGATRGARVRRGRA